MIDLSGHVALVTGGSRGIGKACALRLAGAGADLVLNYVVNRQAAMAVADEVSEMGRRVLVVKADVSEEDDVRSMMEAIKEHFGRLDILISNAATGGFRPLLARHGPQLPGRLSARTCWHCCTWCKPPCRCWSARKASAARR